MPPTKRAPKPPKINLLTAARRVTKTIPFAPDGPFDMDIAPGAEKFMVVTGQNASGKSLFVKLLGAQTMQAKNAPTVVSVSIRERTGGGFRAAFMFGDEAEQSTGATSVGTVVNAFEHNTDRPEGSVLVLDEPELGLSEGYSIAMGTYIGQKVAALSGACSGVILVTHSRPLVQAAVDAYGATPTHVALGQRAGLSSWLTSVEQRTVDELLGLREVGLERWRWTMRAVREAKAGNG